MHTIPGQSGLPAEKYEGRHCMKTTLSVRVSDSRRGRVWTD